MLPSHPYLLERGLARPGPTKAILLTAAGPLVPAIRELAGYRLHYSVEPYIDVVHADSTGARVFRSSRPHSIGSSKELTQGNALPEFVGGLLLKAANPAASRAGYEAFARRGIKVIVDLRTEATQQDREIATKAGLEYLNVKLDDNALHNPMDTLIDAVNAVRSATAQGKSVVIHCEKGIGRTGLVAAAFAATRHPEWTEADVVKYAEDRGLQLLGQKRGLVRFWRALLAGDIVEEGGQLALAEGRVVQPLDAYPERPGLSRASLSRRLTGRHLDVPSTRPFRETAPRGVMEAMTEAAARFPSSIDAALTHKNRIIHWPLIGNAEIGKAARAMIESAEHEVFIETMTFRDSKIVDDIKKGIQTLAKQRPHVKVYVRVSPRMPPFERHESYRRYVEKTLDAPNVIVGTFDPRAEGVGLTATFGLNVSHSKTIVVDNRRALVTDANLESKGDRRADNPKGRDWFQTAIVFEGPSAAKIRAQSAGAWAKSYPANVKLPPPPPAHPGFADGVSILALGQKAGAGRNNAAHQAFLAGFKAAIDRAAERRGAGQSPGERIMIMTPSLNDKDTVDLLAKATEHLHVYVLLSKGYLKLEQSLPFQGGSNEHVVSLLAKAAKDPSRLHLRWFGTPVENEVPLAATQGKGPDMSHAKPILVGDTVWIGSRNLDTQSAETSRELEVVVQSREIAARHYRLFRSIWTSSPTAFEQSPAAAKAAEAELATPP